MRKRTGGKRAEIGVEAEAGVTSAREARVEAKSTEIKSLKNPDHWSGMKNALTNQKNPKSALGRVQDIGADKKSRLWSSRI